MNWPKKFPAIPIHLVRSPGGLTEGWFAKVLLLLLLAWLGFEAIGPRKPELPEAFRNQLEPQIQVAVDDLALRATQSKAGRLAIIHLGGDDSDYVTKLLRTKMNERGIGQQPAATIAERFRNYFHLQHPQYATSDLAIAQGKAYGVDAVVYGKLRIEGTQATIELNLADLKSGTTSGLLTTPPAPKTAADALSIAPDASSVGVWGLLRRLLICVVVILLLPVFTINFLAAIVQRRSNLHNAFILTVYTLAALLIAIFVLWPVNSWSMSLILTALAAGAFVYNVTIMTWALRR